LQIHHLRAFCVVAQEMHVTKAAKRLRIAQPALTQQIRHLERDMGLQLLKRTGRGIALTEAGVFFHKEAEALLMNLHNACLKAQEMARGEAGHIRVGVTEGASFDPTLALVFSQFRAEWPSVRLTFSQNQTLELASDLRNAVIDIAFMCPLPQPLGITTHKLYSESMLLAVPCTHPASQRTSIHVRELSDEPFILITHGQTEHSLESSLQEAFAKFGGSPRILQTVPEFMLALNLVASGIGLTFVPEYMRSIHPNTISYLRIESPVAIAMKTVVALAADQSSPAACNLHELAKRSFKNFRAVSQAIASKRRARATSGRRSLPHGQ
jgi:DNA-binding transcriptional LysR family regulator